ncbi:MAG: hypothetical protein QM715_07955 [Nibricoccus sp.]
MKTNQGIKIEAQQLANLGRQFQNEQRVATDNVALAATARTLMHFPSDQANLGSNRRVDVAIDDGALVFRLMEPGVQDLAGQPRQNANEDTLILASSEPHDVLSAGYVLAEEERLSSALEPYAERSDESDDPADNETVAEVETILEVEHLSAADRMRTRAEIVGFLEGQIKPSVLIGRAIERQCAREEFREAIVERHELKLTIGEP